MSTRLREVSIFRDITIWVTSFVLLKIYNQYKRLIYETTAISICIDIFMRTMSLLCTYKIQERWYNRADDDILKLKHIYSHWRFIKSSSLQKQTYKNTMSKTSSETSSETSSKTSSSTIITIYLNDSELVNNVFRVQEFVVVRFKSRSRDTLNKEWTKASQRLSTSQRRRQHTSESSTHRDFSVFEYVSKLSSMQIFDIQSS